jgi:hypothetical protein
MNDQIHIMFNLHGIVYVKTEFCNIHNLPILNLSLPT